MPICSSKTSSFRFAPDQWLWCFHCTRFFQGRDARPDRVGGVQACAFEGCAGAGYRVDIHDWNAWGGAERWPAEGDLRKGLVADPGTLCEDEPPGKMLERCATLNREHRRRDEILGIVTSQDANDVTHFAGLDLVRLAQLLQERFIHPEEHHNAGPRVVECLDALSRCPELRLHGYAVGPSREDYRVSIEGYECPLADSPDEWHDSLGHAFACVASEADEYMDEGPVLYARWI